MPITLVPAPSAPEGPEMAGDGRPTLGGRIAERRRDLFVGRDAERALFREALRDPSPAFAVLFVHGPGGVGKTALLHCFADEARAAGRSPAFLDARSVEATPPALEAALRDQFTRSAGGLVLLVDSFERLAALEEWFCAEIVPQLPRDALIVIAGRTPPGVCWRGEAGFADLLRVVSLRNLEPAESRTLLRARRIDDEFHGGILEFAHGHPLALCLAADVMGGRVPVPSFRLQDAPHVVRELLGRLVASVPDQRHREALEVFAYARVTTEALIADAVDANQPAALFEWLRSLSIGEEGPEGIYPHDLAREVLMADLRWRNPDRCRQVLTVIRQHIYPGIGAGTARERERAMFDLMHLHRSHVARAPIDRGPGEAVWAQTARPSDEPAILEMAEQCEGADSRRIAAYWWGRQPAAFTMFRDLHGITGFAAHLSLGEISSVDRRSDPVIRATWEHLRKAASLRRTDVISVLRFYIVPAAYLEPSPTGNVMMARTMAQWSSMAMAGIAWSSVVCARAELWEANFRYSDFRSAADLETEVGGRRYTQFMHDWRATPVKAWLKILEERSFEEDVDLDAVPALERAPLLVLSQPEFEEAVRAALRDHTRDDALAKNPLLRSRVCRDRDAQAGASTLRALTLEALGTLQANPRDQKLHRAMHRTYVDPAPTQEIAAERLGLPFSSYRRHLSAGVDRTVAWFWERELFGAPAP